MGGEFFCGDEDDEVDGGGPGQGEDWAGKDSLADYFHLEDCAGVV